MDKTLAIKIFGGQAELARAAGVTRSSVHQWPDPIPEPRASHIRELARKAGYMVGDKVVAMRGLGVVKLETPIQL